MKNIIFAGTHKHFDAVRLAVPLASALKGILAGRKGKLPAGADSLAFAPAVKTKSMAEAFKQVGAERVISVASLPACEAALLAGIPYIYCEPENFKEEKPVKNQKTLLKKAKRVFVLGNSSKALDRKIYGTNAVKITMPAIGALHGQGPRPPAFKKENNLLACARLVKGAGADMLLASWAKLAPLHPTWHLTLMGEGPAKASLQRFIVKNHLSASTEIIPVCPERTALLSWADIYVHPAPEADLTEQLADAMASTLPAVVCASLPWVSAGSNAVQAQTEEEMTAALDSLMVDWGRRVALALEAAKLKTRLSFDVFLAYFE